jgi:hypothetical protein
MFLFTPPFPFKDEKWSGVFLEKVFDPKVKQYPQVFFFIVLNILKTKMNCTNVPQKRTE